MLQKTRLYLLVLLLLEKSPGITLCSQQNADFRIYPQAEILDDGGVVVGGLLKTKGNLVNWFMEWGKSGQFTEKSQVYSQPSNYEGNIMVPVSSGYFSKGESYSFRFGFNVSGQTFFSEVIHLVYNFEKQKNKNKNKPVSSESNNEEILVFSGGYLLKTETTNNNTSNSISNDVIERLKTLPFDYAADKLLFSMGVSKLAGFLFTYLSEFINEIKFVGNPGQSVISPYSLDGKFKTGVSYPLIGIFKQGDECYVPTSVTVVYDVNSFSQTVGSKWITLDKINVFISTETNLIACKSDYIVVLKKSITFASPGKYLLKFGNKSKEEILYVTQ